MSATRRERKVVTVLFADLVGFTSRAESLDPEVVEAILRPYHERLRSELERHGGTVEKFIGDAVMALFGAPLAHEDDPERAVRAALAIRDWTSEEGGLEVRIGITTGEALVSLDAHPEAGQGMASGDVVNTASRLQAAAPTNGILVDETTYRATQQEIDFREADAVEAKGKSEPVIVWEPVEARSRFGIDVLQQAETPLIGRQQEVGVLVSALGRAREELTPQLVTLVGVPGIGKSRLVYELFEAVERDRDLIYWRQGRSLSYGEGVSYWALAEMVKAQAGILDTDPGDEVARKLTATVEAVIDDVADARWIEGHLEPLLGVGGSVDGGEDRQAEAASAWRRFLEGIAEQRPLVLIFEDLHWADDGLLDFIDYLAEWASGVALLIVGTARPELLARRPGWGGGKPNAVTLSLSPLSADETAALISALLEQSVLPAELQQAVLGRAEGNPLYAEEYVRMLQDRGFLRRRGRAWELTTDEELPLPESVQAMIAGRLDALPIEEKQLVQDAAVVGKVFWPGALEALNGTSSWQLEERLHALVRRELVRRERRSSVSGELQYAFLHLLMRDVAYGQIPRAQRVEKHRLTAEWIESLGRAEDTSELLAHHYLAALELADAAGIDMAQIAAKAPRSLIDAGNRASALDSYASAIRFYSAALELLPGDHHDRPYVILSLGRARGTLGEVDLEALAEAVETLVARGDLETAAEAEAGIARILHDRGDRSGSDAHAGRARALVAEMGPSRAKAVVLEGLARSAMLAFDSDAADLGREALSIAEQLDLEDVRGEVLNTLGTIRAALGDARGFRDLEQSIEIARELNQPMLMQRSYNNLGESYRLAGNWRESSRLMAERRQMVERFGIPSTVWWTTGELAIETYYVGDWAQASATASEMIALVEAGTPHYLESICRMLRAKIRLAEGDGDGARADAVRALEQARLIQDPQVLGTGLALRALMLVGEGDEEGATAFADEALAVPVNFYAIVDLAFTLVQLGRGGELVPWIESFPGKPWRVAGLAIAAGDFHAAAEALADTGNVAEESYARLRSGTDADVRRALDFYRSVGAAAYVREGEAMLARSA
jgi:class 3 adenylate cyclase/tetratricopeptide (TPR) repeat protein